MFRGRRLLVFALLLGCLQASLRVAAAAPRYPFPRDGVYAAGTTKPTHRTQAQLDDDVRAFYNYWKAQYVKSAGTDSQGRAFYRVSFGSEDPKSTVSEGQGYGMVIVALMAGYDANAQTIFDGLLRYALAHPSTIDKRLMAWKVPSSVDDSDSAFDGDADIAYGLMLADAQWGSTGAIDYATNAKTRLAGILASTIGPQSRLPMLGDWVSVNGSKYNQDTPRSSDFMPAHFHAWARYTNTVTWNTVASNSAAVINSLQANYSPATGLLPDFIKTARTAPKPAGANFLEGSNDGYFDYNACRDPWRLALDALINGDAVSYAQAHKMSEWARVKTAGAPSKLRAGYKLDGSNVSGNNYFTTAFAAPMAVAAMLDPAQKAWLNALYDSIRTTHEDYFEDSITMTCLLILSGNYWDPTLMPVARTTSATYPMVAETAAAEAADMAPPAATPGNALRLFGSRFSANGMDGVAQGFHGAALVLDHGFGRGADDSD